MKNDLIWAQDNNSVIELLPRVNEALDSISEAERGHTHERRDGRREKRSEVCRMFKGG